MRFFFQPVKKSLDITDALKKKEALITIGGKPVVVKALKLGEALKLFDALGGLKSALSLAQTDGARFNAWLLKRLPQLLAFCAPGAAVRPEEVTLAEFADLLLAVWCVNDLERIVQNFTQAAESIAPLTRGLVSSPK